jgi:hypothetical protein
MDANRTAASGTRPSRGLAFQEFPNTENLDISKIFDHAHIVSRRLWRQHVKKVVAVQVAIPMTWNKLRISA